VVHFTREKHVVIRYLQGIAVVVVSAASASALASCGAPRASSEPSPRPVLTSTVKVDGDAVQAIIASWDTIKKQSRHPHLSLHRYTIDVMKATDIFRPPPGLSTSEVRKELIVDFNLKPSPDAPPNAVIMGGGWVCEVETGSFRVRQCAATQ